MSPESRFRDNDEIAQSPTANLICPICGGHISRIERWIGPPDAQTFGYVDICVLCHTVYARSNA